MTLQKLKESMEMLSGKNQSQLKKQLVSERPGSASKVIQNQINKNQNENLISANKNQNGG